ncbi:MAG: hypothetical protein IKY70_01270 [Bacteroidales bacterium]|nr:hypothetical protein [Bacteroidales bacterium]
MRKFILLLLVAIILLPCSFGFAQELKKDENIVKVSYDNINDAKIDAVVFRGPAAVKYPYRYTGSVYAYSDEFMEGRLYYNKKEFAGLKMNLNAHSDELYLQMYGTGMIIVLDKSHVSNFSLGEHNFINHTPEDGISGLDYGYYEVLHNGTDMLLKRIKKIFNEKASTAESNTAILKQFYPAYSYYVVKDGRVVSFKNKGDLTRIYKEYKSAIKQHIKAHNMHLAGKESKDKVFVSIMDFIEGRRGEL